MDSKGSHRGGLRRLLPLWWLSAMVAFVLAAAPREAAPHEPSVATSTPVAVALSMAPVDAVSVQTGHRSSEPARLRHDSRHQPLATQTVALGPETNDDDTKSHSPAVTTVVRPTRTARGTTHARRFAPADEMGRPSVATGLGRGPPVAA